MNEIQVRDFADQIFKITTDKGFWEQGDKRNKGEMVMLIVGELGECQEAHRLNKFAKGQLNFFMTDLSSGLEYVPTFQKYIKDTTEDELADTVIRILDYMKGFNIPIHQAYYRKLTTENFGHDLLRIVHYCVSAFHEDQDDKHLGKDWTYVLAAIEKFCEWHEIDIWKHVELKIKYNSTRAYKHGKAY